MLEQKAAEQGREASVPSDQAITRSEVQAVDPKGEAALDDAITCLARTLYWEAKGGEAADMQGVASVVMNRLGHEGFPGTVCEVVKQGIKERTCQFSWWCDGRSDDVEEPVQYTVARKSRARR